MVRLVVTMVTFGLGVNIPDIRNSHHSCGAPCNLEEFVQESGCVGRERDLVLTSLISETLFILVDLAI